MKTILTTFIILLSNYTAYAQDIQGVRYFIKYDMLQELAEKDPGLKSSQNGKMPKYMDYFISGTDLLEVYWNSDSTLKGVKIYSGLQVGIFSIDNGKLENPISKFEGNFVYNEILDSNNSTSNIEIVQVESDDIIPTKIYFNKDSLKIIQTTELNDFNAQISFFKKYRVFPLEINIGAPKMIMSFKAEKEIVIIENRKLYLQLLENYESKRKVKKVLKKLKMK